MSLYISSDEESRMSLDSITTIFSMNSNFSIMSVVQQPQCYGYLDLSYIDIISYNKVFRPDVININGVLSNNLLFTIEIRSFCLTMWVYDMFYDLDKQNDIWIIRKYFSEFRNLREITNEEISNIITLQL